MTFVALISSLYALLLSLNPHKIGLGLFKIYPSVDKSAQYLVSYEGP